MRKKRINLLCKFVALRTFRSGCEVINYSYSRTDICLVYANFNTRPKFRSIDTIRAIRSHGDGSHLCDSIRFDRGRHPPIYFVADSSSDAYHKQLYSKPTAYNCFSERTKDVLAYNLYKSTIKLRSDVNYTTRDNVGVRLDCAI